MLDRQFFYAALDAVLPLYPQGVPQRMLLEASAQSSSNAKVPAPHTVGQGDGSSGLALIGHWPCESEGPFTSAEGQLLRAAVEKGLQVPLESVLVLCSPHACAPFSPGASSPLAVVKRAEIQHLLPPKGSIRGLGLLGARRESDGDIGLSVESLPEWLTQILSPQVLIVPMVSLSDIVGLAGVGPNDSAKRELWTDLKRLKAKLRTSE